MNQDPEPSKPARSTLNQVVLGAVTIIAAVVPRLAMAETAETVQLDPFEVIEHPTGADERTAAVWVVSRDEDAPTPPRLPDLLTTIPGVHIDRAGGPGGRSTIYLRGTEENHTLVLLDGVPINDITDSRGGGVDFSAVEPSLVQRIAVVRGPASVRHGPEVLGGIAHIETSSEGARAPSIGVEAGTDHFARAHADAGFSTSGPAILNLGGSLAREGSISDGGRTQLGFARAGVAIRGPVEFRASLWHLSHEADAFPDDSDGRRLAVIRTLEHRDESRTGLALRATGDGMGGKWTVTADAAQFDVTIDTPGVASGIRDPQGLPPIQSDTRLRRFRAALISDWSVTDGSIAAGIDAEQERGRDDSQIDFGGFAFPTDFQLTRTRGGLFVEGTRNLGKGVLFAAGGRVDRYDGEFTRGTGRAGLLGAIGDGAMQWRVNAGTAFKPPSFYGLAHPIVGNPDLAPERVTTAEIGLRRAIGDRRGLIDLTVFTTRTRDAVDFEAGPPPRVVNIDGLRSQGVELAVQTRLTTALTVSGALAYIEARSQPDERRMRSRPDWRGNLGIAWRPADSVVISGTLVTVGSIPDSSIPTGDLVLGE